MGVYLFLRQKNIRTKEFIEYSNDRSSELDVHLFIQCCASAMLRHDLLLLEKNIRGITLLIMLSCHSWQGPGIYSSALYSALADICAVIKIRSLVLARDDVSGAQCFFVGLHILKT